MLFTWENVCRYWAKKGVDVPKLAPEFQLHAVLYFIPMKLSQEVSRLLPYPVSLEFENFITNLWMHEVKKRYEGHAWNPDQPGNPRRNESGAVGLAQSSVVSPNLFDKRSARRSYPFCRVKLPN
jgi:hypothetical protein